MSNIRRTGKPEDIKRVSDLKREFMDKELKVYPATPDVKQVRNKSIFFIDDTAAGKKYIGIRVGGEILKAEVT